MKTTKITIKNLFGIRETTLDGKSVEISGPKGSGKTSVLDAIRYALTNRSDRDYIVHQGADEGEIIIETNTGLSIDRKALPAKSAGTVKVRDGSMLQTRPAEFLAQIFTPLQLDPVKFTQLSRQEKNREILNLIEFQWDMNWIKEQFGEIPQGVDYGQHILEVLNDIQAENGIYFQSRQNINRDIRNKQAFIADIAKDIPSGYDYDRWNNYPSGEKYRELERLREQNSRIERAKAFRSGYDAKLRGLEAQRDMDLAAIDSDIARERASLTGTMERLKAELKATEEKLSGMEQRRQEKADVAQSKYETAAAKLEKDMGVAADYAGREPVDTTALSQELDTAEEMRKHLNEYQRMVEGLAKMAAIPLMTVIQCALNRDMLRESEKHAEHPLYWAFDTKELLKGDMKTRFDAYKVALESNFMQIDEVRYQEDLAPLGLSWIRLGLQDVLYDPKTKRIYTPNTGQVSVMGEQTLNPPQEPPTKQKEETDV